MPKWLANEPVTAIVGLATAVNLCITAFYPATHWPTSGEDALQALIMALAILLARSRTQPTGS